MDEEAFLSTTGAAMTPEDLSKLSLGELETRIETLLGEVDTCKKLIKMKQGALGDAEAIFRK